MHLPRSLTLRPRLLAAVGFAALVATTAVAAAAPDRPHRHPSCFGAAARDPERPCANPELRLSVVPTPDDAQIEPSAPCKPVGRNLDVCAFGARRSRAVKRIALVGDSHAVHWRAPLDRIARRRRWYALTLYRSSCPFSLATARLPEPERSACRHWADQVVGWFDHHPGVRTIFISQHSQGGVIAGEGEDEYAARIRGYVRAWRALPASVRHIVVLRDPPYIATTTLACVKRAHARRKDAGAACALPRRTALKPDPAMVAAARSGGRVEAVDLTDFMCDDDLCFPVVGGVLVHKDPGHLTRLFATTLAPYIEREFERLRAGRG
jgi:hypothetical protein